MGNSYIKSTINKRFLYTNWISVVVIVTKLRSLWLVHFVLLIQFILTLAFDRVILYGNIALSIVVPSVEKRCASFLKKALVFQKFFSKLKYWNRSKSPVIVTQKYVNLLNGGLFQKSFVPFLEEAKVCLLVLKENLYEEAFPCDITKTNSSCRKNCWKKQPSFFFLLDESPCLKICAPNWIKKLYNYTSVELPNFDWLGHVTLLII